MIYKILQKENLSIWIYEVLIPQLFTLMCGLHRRYFKKIVEFSADFSMTGRAVINGQAWKTRIRLMNHFPERRFCNSDAL